MTANSRYCTLVFMNEEKWDKLPYLLPASTGLRSMVIFSNFEATESGWFDTGRYTVTENSVTLGDISVDLYTGEGFSWNGKPDEFSQEQLGAIVNHIVFKDFAELENVAELLTPPQLSGDYEICEDFASKDSTLLLIRHGDQKLSVKVSPNFEGCTIEIDGELAATLIKANEGWTGNIQIPAELLDFIVDYLEDQRRL